MKKKYIVPIVEITICHLEHSFLAGSDSTRNQGTDIGNNQETPGTPDVSQPSIPTVGNEEEVILGSKQFDAWSSWDE